MSYTRGGSDQQPHRRILRTQTAGNLGLDPILDSEVLPSSLVEIAPILRVANEIESSNQRVAYLCRFYAFEKAHRLDPPSNGGDVRQFKTALLQRLERENETTLAGRAKSDAREIQSFYRHYYQKYIQALDNAADKHRGQLTKAYHTAAVLFEVLKAVNQTQGVEISEEILKTQQKVEENRMIYSPYNILPLDPESEKEAIMRFPEQPPRRIFDGEVVPSSLVEIAPILRVANEIESSNQRVAYLCRFHAFEKAHRLDPSSNGRGVHQFKIALLQRLERESETTSGRAKSDDREILSFYHLYCENYLQALDNAADKDHAQLTKESAGVLFEVLKAVNQSQGIKV